MSQAIEIIHTNSARLVLCLPAMRPLLLMLMLTAATGCLQAVAESTVDGGSSGDSGAGGGSTSGADAGPPMYALAQEDCAPNDAPAWTFVLSDSPLSCDQRYPEGLFATIWSGALTADTYPVGQNDPKPVGTSCVCGVVANLATTGSVTIDSVSASEIKGRLDATYKLGDSLHRSFIAVVCPKHRLCG